MMKRILVLAGCACLAGCIPHFKEADSYQTEFRDSYSTESSVILPPGSADPYSFGGIAEGSGGQIARQSYATDTNSPDSRDETESGKLGEIGKDRTTTLDPGSMQTTGIAPDSSIEIKTDGNGRVFAEPGVKAPGGATPATTSPKPSTTTKK